MENKMESEQFSAIMDALRDNTTKLTDLHGDFREFKGVQETKVAALEDAAKSDRFWGRVQTVAVLPIVGSLHQIARHFGWI